MHFSYFLSALAALSASSLVHGFASSTTFDTIYDIGSTSLNNVACSNGANGLLTKGFTTFNSLPSFPFIGGAPGVTWNSTSCGSCWALTFEGVTINVLAIDFAGNGFNIAKEAMDKLTNNRASQLGRVNINAVQVASSVCGL